MASELKVNKISPESGTTLTLGDSGDTINFGSGVLPNFENLTVTGDLTVDTNSLKVDSTNNFVGIGTATPSVALDVVGAITATGNITGTLATASQPNITSVGTLSSLSVSGNITGTLATAAQPNITSVGTLSSLSVSGNITGTLATAAQPNITSVGTLTSATISGDLTVDTSTLHVDSSNNRVGIGNSSPIAPLTVGAVQETGTDRASIAVKTISNSLAIGESAIQIEEQSGTEGYFMGVDSTGGLFFSNSGSANKTLYLGDNDNVGIGTASPETPLHITASSSGGANATVLTIGNTDFTGGMTSTIMFEVDTDGPSERDSAQISVTQENGTQSSMRFFTDNGGQAERMRINGAGRFFVNTTGDINSERVGIRAGTNEQALGLKVSTNAYSLIQGWDSSNNIRFTLTGTGELTHYQGGAIFNQNGADSDFRVESNNNTHMLFVDGGTDRVGIKNSSPSHTLDISDTSTTAKTLRVGQSSGVSTADATMIISNGGTGSAMLRFDYEGTNTDRARIGITSSGQNLQFFTAGNNERMRITSAGLVGIGTSSPDRELTVGGVNNARIGILSTSNSVGASQLQFGDPDNSQVGRIYYEHSDDSMRFHTNNTERMRINSSGNVGIGITSPGVALDVSGAIRATGDITAFYTSDRTLKTNIENISDPINKVKELNGVSYNWTEAAQKKYNHLNDQKEIGVIAQDVEKVLPEMVAQREDGTKAVRYERMCALLIECVKDLQNQIDELKDK